MVISMLPRNASRISIVWSPVEASTNSKPDGDGAQKLRNLSKFRELCDIYRAHRAWMHVLVAKERKLGAGSASGGGSQRLSSTQDNEKSVSPLGFSI